MSTPKFVYFLKPKNMDGPIKIGCSDTPISRLMIFAAWSPFPLELIGSVPGTFKDETRLHSCFSHYHSHGEWFHSATDLQETIQTILAEGSLRSTISALKPTGKIRSNIPRRKRTDCERKCNKYRCSIRATQNRLRNGNEKGAWHAPEDVVAVMSRWSGNSYRKMAGTPPTAMEIVRLDTYLADPVIHSVVPSWQIPKDPICIPIFELASPQQERAA